MASAISASHIKGGVTWLDDKRAKRRNEVLSVGGGFPMDLETIVGFISIQVASGFLKEHGKEIYQKVKGILTDDELISLNLLEANPENKELQDKMAGQLKAHLETNPAIAEELEVLIAKLRVLETKQNALSQTGDDNIALQDVHGSKISIGR